MHSLDHFSITVPDLAEAQRFYTSFGLDVEEQGASLALRTVAQPHKWGLIAEGEREKPAVYFLWRVRGRFCRFRQRLEQHGVRLFDPPPGIETDGVWFRDPDGILIEIRVCEKSSPNQKLVFQYALVPAGQRGAHGRESQATRPRRMSHVLVFTSDVERAYASITT